MNKIVSNLYAIPKQLLFISALLVAILITYFDRLSGWEISLAMVYLLPISFVSWFVGRKSGLFIAVICAALRFIVQVSYPHSSYITVIESVLVRLGLYIFISYLLSSLRQSLLKETTMARYDDMTGAANHRHFDELCKAEISRLLRYRHPFTVGYLDVDDFKRINDTFGHSAGNALLVTTAKTIQQKLRSTDSVSRLGGDEFVVILSETNADAGRTVFNRIIESLNTAVKEKNWKVTYSIGVVTFRKTPNSIDALLQIVDKAMYSIKNNGKNGVAYSVYE